jgi:uncharacterized repeat protein (TIGR01451 family)
MYKAILMIRNLTIGVALWVTAGTVAAITLTPFSSTFQSPIGIDWYEPTGQLIMSVNYSSGLPNNLDLVSVGTGAHTNYSSLAGLTNELKVATVRAGSCQGGFAVGDAFTGNGNPGQIVKIPFASPGVAGVPLNPWVALPLETALVRGSLVQDRFCAAGGDLIVVTGNEQDGTIANDLVGNVWRVTSAGVATKLATLNRHLEGVTTIPNDALVYGPLAGRIITGAEDYITNCGNVPPAPPPPGCGPPNYDPAGGLIIAVNPNAVNDFFTIGGPGTLGITGHTHFLVNLPVHPEDLDNIRANADFFGVAFSMGEVLMAHSTDFAGLCGQILVTQEFPSSNTSGLSTLRWNPGSPGSFSVTALAANIAVQQWEHVTFTSGQDCFGLKVVKSPKQGDPNSVFQSGAQVSFSIVVTNTGALADDITLTDTLPGNGGLVWQTATPSQGSCVNPIVGNALSCNLGTVAAGASVTITVTSTATTPAAACQDQPNAAAIATDTHGNTAQDNGFLTCTPRGSYTLTKNPKGASYNIGDQVNFTIVVTSTGPGTANNVVLNDPLPTLGNLNSWTFAPLGNPGNVCNINAGNTLNCPFGNLANGQTRTVTVTTNVTGGANATACTGAKLNNIATLTGTGQPTLTDTGDWTCQPGSYTLTKNPKGASYNIGDNITFTMVVASTGPGTANNVVLSDPLPTLGNLNSWTITTNPGGACTISSNTLNCSFGNLANGQTRTVVVATNAAGGANATACTGAKLNNTATLTGTGLPTKTDTGDYTCTPPSTGLGSGDTATIGFWANKNGQGVITCENGGASSTALGNWLASNFPNLFGSLAGQTNSQVAAAFVTAKNGASPKTYAQVFGTALAVYVTSSTTGTASCVSKFGFNFGAGTGGKTYNVGSNGAAIGLTNNTSYTVLQLLQQANAVWPWSTGEANAINDIFDGINSKGDIN